VARACRQWADPYAAASVGWYWGSDTAVLILVPAALLAGAAAVAVRFARWRRVDQWFNRARYDADQTVAAFAARLKEAVDLDTVCDDLARVVHTALEPAHVSVWTSRRE
jgi:hypothetical protein